MMHVACFVVSLRAVMTGEQVVRGYTGYPATMKCINMKPCMKIKINMHSGKVCFVFCVLNVQKSASIAHVYNSYNSLLNNKH